MLVYGDPEFDTQHREFVQTLKSAWREADGCSLDGLRPFLIRAGQLEQALADSADVPPSAVRLVSRLVEVLAGEFYRLWRHPHSVIDPVADCELDRTFTLLLREHDVPLRIKVPEGFEFYSVFPEQYCLSAERWCAQPSSASRRTALVLGILSIGTTLSAVVSAVLRAHGWQVTRRTVRPSGHPFLRQCSLKEDRRAFSHALVVDEGPGLSGSSMASVAQAALSLGIREVALFPGHSGMPGGNASPEVIQVWRTLPRYVASPEELRWEGKSLRDVLADATRQLNGDSFLSPVVDLSAGRWRERAEIPRCHWPAVAPAFEASKLLVDSSSRPLLWKFVGLGSARQRPRPEKLERDSPFGLRRLGVHLGYAAFPWIHGPRAAPGRQPAWVLDTLATHLVESAGPAMSPTCHAEAVERLARMLYYNTQQALGESAAADAQACVQAALLQEPGPTYSDGRMGPWEWVRSDTGLVKADVTGDTVDHTLIGRQSILWDVAATIVEWELPEDQAESLSDTVRRRLGLTLGALGFYFVAWCAFRIGLFTMALSTGLDAEDATRAELTIDRLKHKLNTLLASAAEIRRLAWPVHQT